MYKAIKHVLLAGAIALLGALPFQAVAGDTLQRVVDFEVLMDVPWDGVGRWSAEQDLRSRRQTAYRSNRLKVVAECRIPDTKAHQIDLLRV